jgi:hypothetical protein
MAMKALFFVTPLPYSLCYIGSLVAVEGISTKKELSTPY